MRLLPASLAAALVLGAPTTVLAQASSVRDRGPTDGVLLPPTGVALSDEATAPEINPAGLGTLAKPSLFYLHERSLRNDRVGDAAFLGTGLFGKGGIGFGLQWIRPRDLPGYRKSTGTLALGGEFLTVGASFNEFGSDDAALDALTSWDAGVTVRPWKYLALAAAVRDLDAPTLSYSKVLRPGEPIPAGFEPRTLPRRFDVGLAFRPFTDRVSLAGDFLFDDQTGVDGSRLSFAAHVEPLAGLIVSGGLATGVKTGEVVGQVALTLNTPYLGATWSGGAGGDVAGAWAQSVQVRLSAERYRPLPIGRDRVLVLDVPARLSTQSGSILTSILMPSTREPYLELLSLIERVRRDPDIAGVLVKVSGLPDIGHARVEELRTALLSLRTAGKRVWAIMLDGGDDEYLLATAAERIWAVPQATLQVNGYATTATFFAGALNKLGVGVDVAKVGQYKTAPESLTRETMGPEEREMLDAFLDGVSNRTRAAIEKARALPADSLRKTLDQGLLTAKMAKEAGLIDELVYPDELSERLQQGHGRALDLVAEVPQSQAWPRRWGVRPKIGVINVEGLIAEGRSRADPFGLTRIAGAESTLRALDKALQDPLTKAVVLRIESSGGSGAASDLVWRAVKKVREYKPVVVSMGDTAASGGYYIAMAGERIFAEPSTLTGSIGVFAVKPDLGGLLSSLGIKRETLRRGERADFFSISRPWTEGEQQAMQRFLDEFYDQFITHVAEARKMDKAQADAVGRGRIFSGEAAVQAGLVDEIGGLADAVEWARQRVGLSGADVDVEVVREAGMFDLPRGGSGETEALSLVGRALGDAAKAVGVALEMPGGPLTLMPFEVTTK